MDAQTLLGGGTSIGVAIEAATSFLLGLPGREDRSQMMVVMTDGHETGGGDPAAAAAVAKAAGVTIYVVAVDVGGVASPRSGCYFSSFLPSCVDEATMLTTAGDLANLFVVNTFAGLANNVAASVIDEIEVPCATNAAVTVGLDIEPVAVPAVSFGEIGITGTTVTWTMDSVGESVTMTYAADYCHCEYRASAIDFMASATYTDDESNNPDMSSLVALTAQVNELCQTPAPTQPPTPGIERPERRAEFWRYRSNSTLFLGASQGVTLTVGSGLRFPPASLVLVRMLREVRHHVDVLLPSLVPFRAPFVP